jgi:hypothetical protein
MLSTSNRYFLGKSESELGSGIAAAMQQRKPQSVLKVLRQTKPLDSPKFLPQDFFETSRLSVVYIQDIFPNKPVQVL